MSIDPLGVLKQMSPVVGAESGSAAKTAAGFEKVIEQESDALKIKEQYSGEAAALARRLQINLMKGVLLERDDHSDDGLFFSSGLEDLMIQSAAARSQMIDSYAAVQRFSLQDEPQTARQNIDRLIDKVAAHVRLAPELIHSVVNAESDYQADAVSHAGAQGLMQLMPETASELGVDDSFDPEQNLFAGSRYLKQLLEKYDGDLDHALAAYNWGQGNVDRRGLEQMPDETRRYIAKVKQGMAG